jgi:pantothenate synthetase
MMHLMDICGALAAMRHSRGSRDVRPVEVVDGLVRASAAIWIGNTRLIDNILCTPPPAVVT